MILFRPGDLERQKEVVTIIKPQLNKETNLNADNREVVDRLTLRENEVECRRCVDDDQHSVSCHVCGQVH